MLRPATPADIPALVGLENHSFSSDRLSRRSFRHLLTRGHAVILVDDGGEVLRGYVLLLFSRGTSMARLYSIAVAPECKGQGVGSGLLDAAEAIVRENDCVSIRLEIRKDNQPSLALFQRHGYKKFKVVHDYYEDHMDALRFEKHLAPHLNPELVRVPYYQQTLEFTCGPAALMMAMKSLDPVLELSRKLELRLWREATTIFMTAGHGGCSPYGLALAAYYRGFEVEIYVNEDSVFLIDSVRSPEKKEVMRLVQEDMLEELARLSITVSIGGLTIEELKEKTAAGGIPVVLISSYRIYGERFPHWLVVTGFDDRYIYSHDPFVDYDQGETVADSINMPILHHEFQRMARYGRAGQKAVLIVRRRAATVQ